MIRTTGKTTQAVLLSVATLAMLLSGCNQSASVVMNRAGQGYYKMGHYANAAHEFRQALVGDPNNADYAANLAMAMQKSGDLDAAEKMYQRALTANPAHQGAYREYSRMLANQNRPAEALALMQQYVGIEGYRAEPHLQLAELHRELGNRTGEVHALQQALNINSDHPVALARMGTYFQDVGQTQTAMKMYERSLQANSAQPEVYSKYAALQGQAQKTREAKATLARLQQQQQRTAQAIQSYQQQLGSRVASVPQSTSMQIVEIPHQNFVHTQPGISQHSMAFVPDQVGSTNLPNGSVSQALPYQPDYGSQGVMTYSDSPVVVHENGPFFSESQSMSSVPTGTNSTAEIPRDMRSAFGPSVTAEVPPTPVEGPRIAVSPTRVSTALPRTAIPQTVVPSRSRTLDHDHAHGTHNHGDVSSGQFGNDPAVESPVESSGTASDRLIFDDADLLSDTEVWDPIESTKPAHKSSSADSF